MRKRYFEAVSTTLQSSSGSLEQLARVGCVVQSSRSPHCRSEDVDAWAMRYCSDADMAVLAAYYVPTPPILDVVGYVEEVSNGRKMKRIPVLRRRNPTMRELADRLDLRSERAAMRALAEARRRVARALEER